MISFIHFHCEEKVWNGQEEVMCHERVGERTAEATKKLYGKVLCYNHNPKAKEIKEKYKSQAPFINQ